MEISPSEVLAAGNRPALRPSSRNSRFRSPVSWARRTKKSMYGDMSKVRSFSASQWVGLILGSTAGLAQNTFPAAVRPMTTDYRNAKRSRDECLREFDAFGGHD